MVGQPFVLKTTPPRTHRLALVRPRLERLWHASGDGAVTVIEAPRGFGKTTLLAQWRRLWLASGALVAWVTADAQDDPLRFGQALLFAMRVASGRTVFDTLLVQYRSRAEAELDTLTGLLSEIANLATPTVLILDDAERLPKETVEESLAYLLLNAPSNLNIVIGTRTQLALPTAELLARDALRRLTVQDLRLELDESVAVLRARFSARLALDDFVKLHEITEGWPIGLQLAAATIEREPDLARAIESLSGRHGDIERYFVESLFEHLPVEQREFLTRIAILDYLTPELCGHLTQSNSAALFIDQLMADTPVLTVAELRDWIRIHPLARDFLMARFERLPIEEQQALHRRAAEWFAQREQFHDAGRHALAAGNTAQAQHFAGKSLMDLVKHGRLGEARQWMKVLPQAQVEGDLALRLASTWVMALGDQPEAALEIARQIGTVAPDDDTRFVAALIYTCAAAFLDRIGLIEEALKPWAETQPDIVADPAFAIAFSNTRTTLALFRGDTDAVRRIEAAAPATAHWVLDGFPRTIGRLLAGVSHLWDGNALRAEATVQLPLLEAEREAGRRSAPAVMLATVLAAARLERSDDAGAQSVLANRLDMVERTGLPDTLLLAYRTLATIAVRQGDERRALELLDQLRSLGTARGMPRLVMASLAEQVRIHALAAHPETARERLGTLEGMRSAFRRPEFAPFLPLYDLSVAIARAYAALAIREISSAQEALKRADVMAAKLGRGRDTIVIKALRGVAAYEQGHAAVAAALIKEAEGLAAMGGLTRVIVDSHPRAAALVGGGGGGGSNGTTRVAAPAVETPRTAARLATVHSGLLTPKEAQILRLLDASMSNKVIARTMDISDETVKWHLKNLFSKLNAGTRKHAVDRARLLGLISA